MSRWWIHLDASGGTNASHSFHGTRDEAEAEAARHIGKPASWNYTKRIPEPNMWDLYTAWRIEESGATPQGEP